MPAFLLLCRHSAAQWSGGIALGVSVSQPGKAPQQAYASYLPAGGYWISVPVQYELSKHWGVRSELSLVHKNISMERTGAYSGTWEKRYNNYLQLPLMAQYKTGGKKITAYAQAGLFAGYWMSARVQGAVPDIYDLIDEPNPNGGSTSYFRIKQYNNKYSFDSKKDQRFDVGAIGGIGVNYLYKEKYRFFLEARYSQSFNSYEKKYMEGQQRAVHQTAGLMLGCITNLFNSK